MRFRFGLGFLSAMGRAPVQRGEQPTIALTEEQQRIVNEGRARVAAETQRLIERARHSAEHRRER